MDLMLRRQVSSTFKLSGLTLRREACDFLTETLSELDSGERDLWLERIIDFIQRQPIDIPMIEKKLVETAIMDSCKNEIDEEEDILTVISAFEIPRFFFCTEKRKFLPRRKDDVPQIYDSPETKGTLYKDRYDLIYQLTIRNSLFNGLSTDGNNYKLKPIEFLLSSQDVENVVVLGLLANLKEGQYFLEDPSGVVRLDLSETTYYDGLFTEGSFVLAEGIFQEGVFQVHAIGLPPREDPESSRSHFVSGNYFGGPSKLSLKNNDRLKKIEKNKDDAMIIFISDVWLDQPDVLNKLGVLFRGYSEEPPYAFVLMGNFLSGHKGFKHFSCLKEGFKSMAELISQNPSIANTSKFIIIPGPYDSPAANILPRPELPEFFVSDLKAVVKSLSLATSPCRIQYCTQEIVIVREDLVTKLCRNCITYPTNKDIGWHFSRSIINQATLVPLSLNVCPVYWNHISSLQLYPCPELIVVGDQQKPFAATYNKSNVINPGSFSKGDFTFKVYYPSSRTVDECQINNDDD